ncbi:dienelactone hydrolase family protein [Metarhizium album ARSEF 1941]|uniref:Dienelactone hydrolase family protein n=1 Tax=Metarhizium album (strain ARSEF 1941) TaxID=1081103 RepID=A0A0B2WX76_METAS|nr:dienelactone hydrolase family protein [Metarhizium album ARSEF 1941]KHN97475.1 dienelactone hydrolase family protein [Metarhizium album ARSEF 1941]
MSCPNCFRGQIHKGPTKGNVIKLYGLDTYVSEPPNGKAPRGIVVIIPDAFGWEFPNNRILADNYAEKGDFKVYLPDFMNGHAAPVSMLFSIQTALAPGSLFTRFIAIIRTILVVVPFFIHCAPRRTYSGVRGFFEQLRKEQGQALSIGAAGFCWGGKHVVTLAHGAQINGQPLVDAGFTAHPSMLRLPSDVEKIKRPVSFACAEDDNQISLKQAEQIKAIVTAFPDAYKGELRVYQKTSHGFAVRADLKVPDVAAQAAAAEDQAVAWFTSHF